MKFEFSMDVKGIPTASVACKFECTNDELVTLISDPVYQELGQKLIREVSFAPKAPKAEANVNSNAVVEELCGKVNEVLSSIKKEREANAKGRQHERDIVEKLYRRMADVAERTQKF